MEGPPHASLRRIPTDLYSVYHGGLFPECSYCSVPLLVHPIPYHVEKVVQGTETISELALCAGCAERLRQDFSRESAQYLSQFVARITASGEGAACAVCGLDQIHAHSYQLGAICLGSRLLDPHILMFCESCGESLQGNLSRKTRERLDDFRRDVLDLFPDEMRPAPSDLPSLLI